ncbi:sugar kinase [Sediminispirochaeta smaragdinae]|uniref:PfkB domain protein n=1 Tax=Sediminispirochaeta smaragdinae (strain DSM 11293 / JCM 15392 / SEBR 4228) TaxID=573413 RepID=E1RB44_SEDSS|nr:sugar kinase [Sediminispirochaeta smaragdinae]ADK79574.1 PfkB domain protein [Sediminispirochaeta smaragdinae DSM 11293]
MGARSVKNILVWGEPMFGFYPIDNPMIEKCNTLSMTWGGDASNFAIGVARLDHHSVFFTGLGTEPFGDGFIDLWMKNGVDVSQVVRDPSRRTGFYFVSFINGKHNLTYYRENSAATAIQFAQLDQQVLKESAVFHFTGTGLGMGSAARTLCRQIIDAKKGSDCIISFDVNYRTLQWNDPILAEREISNAIASGVTHLDITDDEMFALGWGTDLDALIRRFPTLEVIAYKQGPKGVTIKTRGSQFDSPAFLVKVKDTVGAGDSFDVGFIISLLEGKSLEEAARIGNATGGLTCTGLGPISSSPTRKELDEFLAT